MMQHKKKQQQSQDTILTPAWAKKIKKKPLRFSHLGKLLQRTKYMHNLTKQLCCNMVIVQHDLQLLVF